MVCLIFQTIYKKNIKFFKKYNFEANGTNRGEACVTILLQKSTEAKRSYGTVLNVTGVCGETNNSLFQYSKSLYKDTLINAYKEIRVDPTKVGFIEGEGIGIKVCLFSLYNL